MATYGSYKKIRTDAIVPNTITATKVAPNTLTTGKFAAGAVGTNQLAATLDLSSKTLAYRPILDADISSSAAITTSKITGLATSATTDTTNATNITTGTLDQARITTLSSSKLTGPLPAINGAALTRLGKKFEVFYYTIADPGTISPNAVVATFSFTTTFTGNIHMGWSYANRPYNNGFHYFYPDFLPAGGSWYSMCEHGMGWNYGNNTWNCASGAVVYDFNGPRAAGTHSVRLYHASEAGATISNAGDEGNDLYFTVWNIAS